MSERKTRQSVVKSFHKRHLASIAATAATLFLLSKSPADKHLQLILSTFIVACFVMYVIYLIAITFVDIRAVDLRDLRQYETNLLDLLSNMGDWTTDEAVAMLRNSPNVQKLKKAVKKKWKRKALQPFTVNFLDSL